MDEVESGETGVSPSETKRLDGGPQLAEVSREMVKLYKAQLGRGPLKAQTIWAGKDMIVCTLEDTLTPAERDLRDMGEHQRLRDVRMFFQYARLKGFVEPVERIMGRKVRSFVSGIDTETDFSTEVFAFYPAGEDGPSRAEAVADRPSA